jgi:hypothetical protein
LCELGSRVVWQTTVRYSPFVFPSRWSGDHVIDHVSRVRRFANPNVPIWPGRRGSLWYHFGYI